MMTKTPNGYLRPSQNCKRVKKTVFDFSLVLLTMTFFFLGCQKEDDMESLDITTFPGRQRDFTMWQLAQFDFTVQMCYIIKTDDGKITVVDGGMTSSSEIVQGYLQQLGGHVHTWITTHPHIDHIGVLQELLNQGEIRIDRLLHSKLNEEWVFQFENRNSELISNYYKHIAESGLSVIEVEKDETFDIGDGVDLEIIAVKNDSITVNAVNNSSIVFKIKSKSKSILFTGDLGVDGGDAILKSGNPEKLRADYVQMAHHGQRGVGLEFYKAVNADYALWPTPKWLWENRAEGQGPGTGNFKTLEVRSWVENELNIKKNYVSGLEGNIQID